MARNINILFLLLLLSIAASAKDKNGSRDSLPIEVPTKDTTAIYYKKSILFNQTDSATHNEQQFYSHLKNNASRNRITKILHDLLITTPSKHDTNKHTHNNLHTFNGKTIRTIRIKQLNVFGASIKDTTRTAKTFLEKSGNAIHKNTNKRTLKKLILLNSGDIFSDTDALENERIIRTRSFIYDCKIVGTPVKNQPDLIDLTYIIQDVFSYGIEAHGTLEEHGGAIYNNNFLSEGHKIQLGVAHSTYSNARKTWGPNLQYIIRNINGSFIDAKMVARDTYSDNTYRFSLEKKFLTYDTKYAGQFEAQRVKESVSVFRSDTRKYGSRIDYNSLNIWLGRSFLLSKSARSLKPNNIILASRLQRYNFTNGSDLTNEIDLNNFWMVMSEINLSKSQYEKGNLLYGYGRTEDVPYGYSAKLSWGNKWINDTYKPYTGISLSAASRLSESIGYFSGALNFGGYLGNNKLQEGVFKCQFKYFSPLLNTRKTLSRHFISALYIKGTNRVSGDSLYLNNGSLYLEAFDTQSINGLQKLVFSYENVFFMRQRLLGFRLALYSFCDYGGVGIKQPLEHDYLSFGAGLRLRNDNLIFNTIQIRIAYLPKTPHGLRQTSFRISDEKNRDFTDFRESTIDPIVFR